MLISFPLFPFERLVFIDLCSQYTGIYKTIEIRMSSIFYYLGWYNIVIILLSLYFLVFMLFFLVIISVANWIVAFLWVFCCWFLLSCSVVISNINVLYTSFDFLLPPFLLDYYEKVPNFASFYLCFYTFFLLFCLHKIIK